MRSRPTARLSLPQGNLWIAKTLFELGGVQFGDFTLGRSTVHSPVYINARLLVSKPRVMKRIARIIDQETTSGMARLAPRFSPFDLVAGVPFGGLHLAGAFSLRRNIPLIYPRFDGKSSESHFVEGRYQEGQTALIIDDLITSGGSVLQSAALLREAGLEVKDAIVLIDREQGAAEQLRKHHINLTSLLPITVMLKFLWSSDLISDEWYERSMAYLKGSRGHPSEPEG